MICGEIVWLYIDKLWLIVLKYYLHSKTVFPMLAKPLGIPNVIIFPAKSAG